MSPRRSDNIQTALPLIAWTLWTRGRGFSGGLAQPAVQIPGVLALVVYLNLLAMPDPKMTDFFEHAYVEKTPQLVEQQAQYNAYAASFEGEH